MKLIHTLFKLTQYMSVCHLVADRKYSVYATIVATKAYCRIIWLVKKTNTEMLWSLFIMA